MSKKFIIYVRQNSLRSGDVALQHDFTEALAITHNEEIQSKHFGGSVTVSIEGYTCHYRRTETDPKMILDFHSFLSDDTTQMASTVYCHMGKLLSLLTDTGQLASGGRVLATTDGCAKQYKCATSIYFMTLLASKYDIVMDRSICCPGHGKSIVDAVNGVDKNTILRRSMRMVQSPDAALSGSSSSLQVHSFNNVAGGGTYSAAEDCKRILEMEAGEGVKSVVKREKREQNRGINRRYWHVRKVSEKLNELKCATIKIDHKNLSFKDMYHYYTCKELGIGKAALRQVPCSCNACDETIRLPWEAGRTAVDQPRFKRVTDCFFDSALGDSNQWFIVDIDSSEKGDIHRFFFAEV